MPRAAGHGAGWIGLARIAGAHGVKGVARLVEVTENPGLLERCPDLRMGEAGRKVAVQLVGPCKGGWLARISGLETREQVQALSGTRLCVPRSALGRLGEDEFYDADFDGLEAVDQAGARLGKVVRVANYGAGDLLEIALDRAAPGLGKTVLIPFERTLVPEVDITGGALVVDLEAWLDRQREAE